MYIGSGQPESPLAAPALQRYLRAWWCFSLRVFMTSKACYATPDLYRLRRPISVRGSDCSTPGLYGPGNTPPQKRPNLPTQDDTKSTNCAHCVSLPFASTPPAFVQTKSRRVAALPSIRLIRSHPQSKGSIPRQIFSPASINCKALRCSRSSFESHRSLVYPKLFRSRLYRCL